VIEFGEQADTVEADEVVALNKDGRATTPTNATVFKKSGDLAITGGKVLFGRRDKVTVAGDLSIKGAQGVEIPDVNAVDLKIEAGGSGIKVLGREPAPSANSKGSDRGADIVADSITLTGELSLDADTTGQKIVDVGTRAGGADGEASPASLKSPFVLRTAFLQGGPVTAAELVSGDVALDLTPGGAARGSERAPKNPVPFLLERPSGGVTAAAASQRPLRSSEISAFLDCDPDDKICQEEIAGAERANSDEARVLRESVAKLFGGPGSLPTPAPGSVDVAAPPPSLAPEPPRALVATTEENPKRAALQRAVDAYQAQVGSVRSGVGFRQFVESSPEHSDALEALDDVLAVYQAARAFGRSGEGVGDFKDEILAEIAPQGISLEVLDSAVQAGALGPSDAPAATPPSEA
jgi:hypothetical protein